MVQAGNQVAWAFRGFNPHRKKSKSYYVAHLAQTGQRNRGNDAPEVDAFLRLIGELQGGLVSRKRNSAWMAFFNEKILKS